MITTNMTKFGKAIELLKDEPDTLEMFRNSRSDRKIYIENGCIYEKSPNYKNYFIPSNEDMFADDWILCQKTIEHKRTYKSIEDLEKEEKTLKQDVDEEKVDMKGLEKEIDKLLDECFKPKSFSISSINGKKSYKIDGKEVSDKEFYKKYQDVKYPNFTRDYIPVDWQNYSKRLFFS